MGRASKDEPICPGPQKYGSLLLRIQTSVREQIDGEETGHPMPRDGAPNKAIKPHFPEQTASFPRHAPLFPDTLTLLLGPRHAWILVNFSQIMVDCTG
jgi:hypothetical protein